MDKAKNGLAPMCYKPTRQEAAETRFRLLKDPALLDAIYLKQPRRIEALGILLPGKRKSLKPTAEMLLTLLQTIQLTLYTAADGQTKRMLSPRISENVRRVVELAGSSLSIYGKLYALSPTFAGKALYYNKTIFDRYGVQYPTNEMSWEDVLQLASRISASDDKEITDMTFGFYFEHDLFSLAQEIAASRQIRYVDAEGKTIKITSDSWRKIFDQLINGSRERNIYTRKDLAFSGSSRVNHPFTKGQAAMTVDYSYLLNDLQNVDFRWDVVTIPIDPIQRGSTTSIQPNALFAISSQSEHTEESWRFIEYINGEDYSKLIRMSGSYDVLLAREELNKPINNVNLHAFYRIEPIDQPTFPLNLDQSTAIYDLVEQELRNAIATNLDTVEFLAKLEAKMQLIIGEE